MAPMVDVLLVLLVFFMMITSAQVLKVDRTIKLPIAKDALKKDNTRSEAIVNVRWDAQTKKASFVFDDKSYTNSEDVVPLLKTAKAAGEKKITQGQNPAFRLVIRGDHEAPALYISQAMNAGGEAGISDISFSTVNKE